MPYAIVYITVFIPVVFSQHSCVEAPPSDLCAFPPGSTILDSSEDICVAMNRALGHSEDNDEVNSNPCSKALAANNCWEYVGAFHCASECPTCGTTSDGVAAPMCADHFLGIKVNCPEVFNACYSDLYDLLESTLVNCTDEALIKYRGEFLSSKDLGEHGVLPATQIPLEANDFAAVKYIKGFHASNAARGLCDAHIAVSYADRLICAPLRDVIDLRDDSSVSDTAPSCFDESDGDIVVTSAGSAVGGDIPDFWVRSPSSGNVAQLHVRYTSSIGSYNFTLEGGTRTEDYIENVVGNVDLDGDGFADAVFSISDNLGLWYGDEIYNSSQVFSPLATTIPCGGSAMAVGDFDGDGMMDVFCCSLSNVRIIFGGGADRSAWGSSSHTYRANCSGYVAVGHFTDHQSDDVVFSVVDPNTGEHSLAIIRRRGWSTFTGLPPSLTKIHAISQIDVDTNGIHELLVCRDVGPCLLFYTTDPNHPPIQFHGERQGWHGTALHVVDANCDGRDDVIIGGVEGTLSIFLNFGFHNEGGEGEGELEGELVRENVFLRTETFVLVALSSTVLVFLTYFYFHREQSQKYEV